MSNDKYIDVNNLTDEQIDALFAERKTNTLKSAAPLYVYLVLQEHSNPRKHLTQKQIISYVEEEFYVTIERKALSRWLHLLMALDLGIYSDPHYGTWLEKNKI